MTAAKMTLLEAALQPLTLDDLKTHYDNGACLVLEGSKRKFEGLVTLSDIEHRLNDGCNASAFPQIIKQGTRLAHTDPNCVWTSASLSKTQFIEDLQAGFSFMLPNASQLSRGLSTLCDEIEAFFADDQVHADVHLYVSTSEQGGSYNAHRDLPQHKLLLQAYGDANWQIFEPKTDIPKNMTAVSETEQEKYLKLASEFTLTQGDLLYMPPGTFHRVVSVTGPRISISIPFFSMPQANRMDRSFIPFKTLFNARREDQNEKN